MLRKKYCIATGLTVKGSLLGKCTQQSTTNLVPNYHTDFLRKQLCHPNELLGTTSAHSVWRSVLEYITTAPFVMIR